MDKIIEQLIAAGFEPQVMEDGGGFEPVTGKYLVRIDACGRQKGESNKDGTPYDFYSLQMQVVEIIEGDKATNRFFKKSFDPTIEGLGKLLSTLFTAGIEVSLLNSSGKAKTDEELEEDLSALKDKTMSIRCWVWTPDKTRSGEPIPEDQRKASQQFRVVKGFGKNGGKPGTAKSDVPF